MWLMTIYGFFSIACAKNLQTLKIDPDTVMIRARVREHLQNLKDRFPEELGAFSINETPKTDYRYRLIVPKPTWVSVLSAMQTEQNYGNFKKEVGLNPKHSASGYENALHKVWRTMLDLTS